MKRIKRFFLWLLQIQYVLIRVVDTDMESNRKPKVYPVNKRSVIEIQAPRAKVPDFIIGANNINHIVLPADNEGISLTLKVDFIERYYDIVTGQLLEIVIYSTF